MPALDVESSLSNSNQLVPGLWCQLLPLFPPNPPVKTDIEVREYHSPNSNGRILIDAQASVPRKHGMQLAIGTAAVLLLMASPPTGAMASQKVLQGGDTRLDKAFESFALDIMQEFHVPGLAIGVVEGDNTWTAVSFASTNDPMTGSHHPDSSVGGPEAELSSCVCTYPGLRQRNTAVDPRDAVDALLRRQHHQGLHNGRLRTAHRRGHCAGAIVADADRQSDPGGLCASTVGPMGPGTPDTCK